MAVLYEKQSARGEAKAVATGAAKELATIRAQREAAALAVGYRPVFEIVDAVKGKK